MPLKRFRTTDNMQYLHCMLLLFISSLLALADALYEGDPCSMKSINGVCTLSSKCTTLEAAIQRGELTVREIVSCGFDTHEEIICCPTAGQVTNKPPVTTPQVLIFEETTNATKRDFWEDLLTSSSTSTTAKPDFWLDLLTTSTSPSTSTSTSTTTTTTDRTLSVGDKELDPNSEFFDFSKLLTSKNRPNAVGSNSPNDVTIQPQQPNNRVRNVNNNKNVLQGSEQNNNVVFNNDPSLNNGFGHGNQFIPLNFVNQGNFRPGSQGNGLGRGQGQGQGQGHIGMFPGPPHNRRFDRPRGRSNDNNLNFMQQNGHINNGFGFPGHGFGKNRGNNEVPIVRWIPNGDVELVNPPSRSIWPNQNENSIRNSGILQWNNSPVHGSLIQPIRDVASVDNNIVNSSNVASPFNNQDPIAYVNEQLVNSGMDIVKAQQTNFNTVWDREQQNFETPITTTTKDPFEPFQFRPQPQYDDNHIEAEWPHAVNGGGVSIPGVFTSPKPTGRSTSSTSTSTATPVVNRLDERPAVKACKAIDDGLTPALSPHILDGTPVELGEYPHMAAIGYSAIGNEGGPYDFRCGGSLIDKRFVLTAAHCVTSRDSQPVIVRMGVANFSDADQMRNAVEIKIERVHIHPEYSNSRKYNDIAILQLERGPNYTANVYPVCLYSDLNDPPSTAQLFVTGWGTVNTTTREFSNSLLKARLQIAAVTSCNQSYAEIDGHTRQLSRGVDFTQLCAFDAGAKKDACQGDSGGPLNLVLDENTKKYRVVGVISAGSGCGSIIPGLYTRVAAFLDYIESVVWPIEQ